MDVVQRVDRQVASALRRAGSSGGGTRIVVAASGGPDSSALLHSLSRLQERHGLKLHVAHLVHDFRGEESAQDARFTESLAQALGLPVTVEQRDPWEAQRRKGGRGTSSYEQAAREVRYAFLAEVAARVGAGVVAAGHTADDLAETTLLHLLRGSGIHGLRGMEEVSSWPFPVDGRGPALFRPLLGATKEETEAYCRALGWDFREDSENRLPRYTRNRVRHHLMPVLEEYNPRVKEALVRLARTAALEVDFLEEATDEAWGRALLPTGAETDVLRLDRAVVASLHPLLRRLLMRRAYAALRGDTRRLHESHLVDMERLCQEGTTGARLDLPQGLALRVEYRSLALQRDYADAPLLPLLEGEYHLALPGPGGPEAAVSSAGGWRVTVEAAGPPLSFRHGPMTAYLLREALREPVVVRGWRPGDRFQPLGMAQEKKLQDFFTDAKVPRSHRGRVPLVLAGGRVAWVVGYRIAEWARAPDASGEGGEVVRVTFEEGEEEGEEG